MSDARVPVNATMFDAVVVGGGLAGLTAAWFLRDLRILLLESEPRFGGRIKSEPRGPYWLNFAAHLLPPSGSLVNQLASGLGLKVVPVTGAMMALELEGKVLMSGRVETYPLRLPLSLRERIAFSRAGLRIRRAVTRFKQVAVRRDGESDSDVRTRTAAYLSNVSFSQFLGPLPGRAATIFRTASHRIPAEPEDVSAGAGVSLFSEVWGGKGTNLARNLLGGSGRLPEGLARALGDRAHPGCQVVGVREAPDAVTVDYVRKGIRHEVSARHVILATPANVTRKLLRNLPQATERALSAIRYGPFLSMAILTGEASPTPWDGIYAMACAGRSFDMFFNHANVLRKEDRDPGGSLMVYAGGESAFRLMDRSDDEIRDVYLRDLYSVFPDSNGMIRECLVQRWDPGNAYRSPGMSVQPDLEEADFGNVHLAGDYFGQGGNMETAARTGREAANRIRSRIGSSKSLAPPEAD